MLSMNSNSLRLRNISYPSLDATPAFLPTTSLRVYDSSQQFHAFLAASFGRKQWRAKVGSQTCAKAKAR